jgi:hypothetical protein
LWERYIDWELERKNYRNITAIFRRLVGIPTKFQSHKTFFYFATDASDQ